MPKSRLTKFFAFAIGLGTIFSIGEISADRLAADISTDQDIQDFFQQNQATDEIEILEKSFEAELSQENCSDSDRELGNCEKVRRPVKRPAADLLY